MSDVTLDEAMCILEELVDADRCMYDHNAFCQTHYSGEPGRECYNGQALKLIARWRGLA